MRNTLAQGYAFLLFLYGGILLGTVCGIYDCIHRRFHGKIADALFDFITVISGTGITAAVFLFVNGGQFRFYGFLTIALGFLLAQYTFVFYLKSFTKRLQSTASKSK